MKPAITILSKLSYLIFSLLIATSSLSANALPEAEAEDEVEMEAEEEEKKTVYFPQFKMFETVKNEEEMSDEISGRLDLVDECLRLVTRQGTYLLIWPGWYDFSIAGRAIVVSKVNTNSEVAYLKIGDKLSVSGAEIVYFPTTALQFKIPDHCLGPFLAVGAIESVKNEVEITKESHPAPKQYQKVNKDNDKPVKIVAPYKKELPKKLKRADQSSKQLKKLEIMLEKTMLK